MLRVVGCTWQNEQCGASDQGDSGAQVGATLNIAGAGDTSMDICHERRSSR